MNWNRKSIKVGLLGLSLMIGSPAICAPEADVADRKPSIKGKMVYHTYSSYNERDSRLYVLDFETGQLTCLNDYMTGVYHTMNASFNPDGSEIVFMGIINENNVEEWNIFRYHLETKVLQNLTAHNDLRNEDPKFSPDGIKVIYKQGYWDRKLEQMIYDLWEIDVHTGLSRQITHDISEQSMPYYSSSGDIVYYMEGNTKESKICSIDLKEYNRTEIYYEKDVYVYYPVVYEETLYFLKWYSADNFSDVIVSIDLGSKEITIPTFNSSAYNSSDPCPISDKLLVVSSTMSGGRGGYDLYIVDRMTGSSWSLNEYSDSINNEKHQLGADCYIESITYKN